MKEYRPLGTVTLSNLAVPWNICVMCIRENVVLCAGSIKSPQLLMLSGIGAKKELASHGIECKVDLPGGASNEISCYTLLEKLTPWCLLCNSGQESDGPPMLQPRVSLQ